MAAARDGDGAGATVEPVEETAVVLVVPEGEEKAGKEPAPKENEAPAKSESIEAEGEEDGDSDDDDDDEEEDVYEVEQIIDYKTEDGEVLYRVRWKGYTADEDTWEPASHLEDCREVLLAFRKKHFEPKTKPSKKETQKLSLRDDVFEADSDSDWQSDSKEDSTQKKKNKKNKDDAHEEMKKKKSKSGKMKDKHKTEAETTDDSLVDLKAKKRLSEGKEDYSEVKKTKKEESKEHKKIKKIESKDTKAKLKDESKDQKKQKKEKNLENQMETEESPQDLLLEEPQSENVEMQTVSPEEMPKSKPDCAEQKNTSVIAEDEQADGMASTDEDEVQVKVKKKKKKEKIKKHERHKEEVKPDVKSVEVKEVHVEKKSAHKKQRILEKIKAVTEMNRQSLTAAFGQKSSRLGPEEKSLKSADCIAEHEKETKKNEPIKEKPRRKHDIEKEVKKEHKAVKNFKEMKSPLDMFTVTPEDRTECSDNYRKKDDSLFERSTDKQLYKERRNARDETDTWSFIAAEGEQEVLGSVSHIQENSDAKQQVLSLGVDLQLEWMTLEDLQKHLDGEDEIVSTADAISNTQLRDAVRNGDYTTVKFALNSKEQYDLEQEDSSGMTLVMFAAAGGHDDILRLLVKKGSKINSRQKNGTTALIHAAEKNFLTSAAILLDAGAYVNIQQNNGETALMKACKRGNSDVVRLMIEAGADCNTLSKHQNSALHFAKQSNNVLVYELLKSHLETVSRVAEDTIRDYFESRLVLLDTVFPISCYRLCEGPDFALDFNYRPPHVIPEGSGILLFVFHANFFGKDVVARLCGPCSVQAVVLNDKFQLPVFLDSHFIYSFNPVSGMNKLFIRLIDSPTAKVR
ncbi:M-phase phosphoprotein 8 isoform X2 [Ambystoma mexicanum]|uniref:M-phase phosphoprotein 8 isoform X2 n=1 Tax=Ambystoma mexicanum TaxID=8296 RepID=UPI0037E7EFE0